MVGTRLASGAKRSALVRFGPRVASNVSGDHQLAEHANMITVFLYSERA